jgi:hypothetical protein
MTSRVKSQSTPLEELIVEFIYDGFPSHRRKGEKTNSNSYIYKGLSLFRKIGPWSNKKKKGGETKHRRYTI